MKEPIDFDAQVNVTASASDSLKASVPDVPSYFRAQVARRLPPVVRVCNRCRGHLRKGVAFTVLWQSPAVEEGLVTPVIREAQSKTIVGQISAAIKDLASRARSKKLKLVAIFQEAKEQGSNEAPKKSAYTVENTTKEPKALKCGGNPEAMVP